MTEQSGERLAELVRRLIDHLVAADVPEEDLAEAVTLLQKLDDTLTHHPRALARTVEPPDLRDLQKLFSGDPVVGKRNPIAPPVDIEVVDGAVVGRARFGRAYEGPPGYVHGAIVASVFDQLLGLSVLAAGRMGMTGTLSIKYRAPTPLHTEVVFRGRAEPGSGRKIVARGTLHAGDTLCAEAEGLFVKLRLERALELFSPPPAPG